MKPKNIVTLSSKNHDYLIISCCSKICAIFTTHSHS